MAKESMRLFYVIALVLPSFLSVNAFANGWEHGAVPFQALIDALSFDDETTRDRAAHSLGFRGQNEAVPHLIKALEKPEKSATVRTSIYISLGQLGDPRARPSLLTCLETETRDELQATCARALGAIKHPESSEVLIRLIQSSQSALIKARAIAGLGQLADTDAIDALASIAGAPTETAQAALFDEEQRTRAIRALGRTRSPEAGSILASMLKVANDPADKHLLMRALLEAPSIDAAHQLRRITYKETDPPLRALAVLALAAAEGGEASRTLTSLLVDPSPLVQLFAIETLGRLKPEDAATPLSLYASNISRWFAGRSLATLTAAPDRALDEATLVEAALRANTEIKPEFALTAYLVSAKSREIVGDGNTQLALRNAIYRVRRAALYGLGYTRSPRAARLLEGSSGISDPDPRLRAVAARSIGVLGLDGATGRLIPLLTDKSAEVRWTVAEVLGALGDVAAVEALGAALSDKDSRVRAAAAQALGFLPAEKVRSDLLKARDLDDSEKVRAAAAFALQRLDQD